MRDITKNINASNLWLKTNRNGCKPIKLNEVINRLKKGNFLGTENSKTIKGNKEGFLTAILYLAPHKIVGHNFCPMAITCILDCLFNSGRGKFNNVTRSRIIKTLCFLLDKDTFINHIDKDIQRLYKKSIKLNYDFCVRLNGTSDLNVVHYFGHIIKNNPFIKFYDYTKVKSYIKNNPFKNYSLTFSYDGLNLKDSLSILDNKENVSIVFENNLPKYFLGFHVIDGDKNDLRFLDKKGIIIGLKHKKTNNKVLNDAFIVKDANSIPLPF
jgi:hypothetical protein